MSSENLLNPRKPLIWLLGLAAAAAFFASGALVARATIDDDGDDSGDRARLVVPGIGFDGGPEPAIARNTGAPGDLPKGMPASRGGSADASYPACRSPLPPGVITATGIDWAKANFTPSLPSSGFSALSLSLSSQGQCDKNGTSTRGAVVLDSSWIHDGTLLEAYVSQRASTERVASVIRQDSATFWANGYVFHVGVNAYHIMPVAEDLPAAGPASDPGTSSSGAGSSGSAPDRPTIAPAPPADPRAAEVLRELIAQLSPSLDQKCFWTMGQGDWTSLASVGIGDPRPAVPSGFTQQEFNVTAFTAPPAGCDTSVKPTEGFSFNAGWQKEGNGFAYLGVSVYNNGFDQDYPGQIGEYGANWSNNGLQFGVFAKSEQPLGIDVVRALAKALDPNFNEACFVRERTLSDSDLPGLGFSPAKAPDVYKLVRSNMVASEIAAGCPKPEGFEPSYNLNWSFEKGADVIDAGANRYGESQRGDGSGYQSANHLNWTSANGTNFYVNGYSKGVSPAVSKDDLVAVAKSIDPAFDITKLKDAPDGGEKPIPLPAERSARP